ncbi:hypothetical protein BH11MYX1_BH11MYX1_02140 [soil metagenome]
MLSGVARAQASWDSRGWVQLGDRTVNGKADHDRIDVGRMEGTFSKLTVVVENSDLEMIDFKIQFADNTNYHPALDQVFREGTRTRVIELPPGEHVIKYLDFKYKNLPGGGNAKVSVWAWKTGTGVATAAMPPPPPAPVVSWNPAGWTLLGERTVNGRVDHDRIEVGRYEGTFTKMTLVVTNSDLEMIDLSVKFGKGDPWHPALQHYFREGTRSHQIDFPGDERTIKYVDFKYRNLPGGGDAKVQVWAKAENGAPASAWHFDAKGWEMLGEREVDGHGREDIDRIQIGRAMGKFHRITVVVLDSELEMIDLSIKFNRGAPLHPTVSYYFREGTRTRVIDLPGDRERMIKWIEFKYRNVPGGGRAKVQVWAQ